jgi:PASTA domain
VAGAVLALAVAAPASANAGVNAAVAPIGTGSYLITLTNSGPAAITGFVLGVGEEPKATNIVPSPACQYGSTPVSGSLSCNIPVAAGASTQVCYTGHAPVESLAGSGVLLLSGGFGTISSAPAVTSCPLAGFNGGSGGSGGTTKCVVPKVKGKKLAAAEKAIKAAHCAVGKVKKAKSSHVKKGSVISQGTAAGKSLPTGTKVPLIVSKGK